MDYCERKVKMVEKQLTQLKEVRGARAYALASMRPSARPSRRSAPSGVSVRPLTTPLWACARCRGAQIVGQKQKQLHQIVSVMEMKVKQQRMGAAAAE